MKRNQLLYFILSLIVSAFAFGDDFIKWTRPVEIPKAPGAYNASFIEYEEGFLMAFRYDTYILPIGYNLEAYHQYICLIKLDRDFNPIGEITYCRELGDRAYDPRLVRVGSEIYLTYSSARPEDAHSSMGSVLRFTNVQPLGGQFRVMPPLTFQPPFQSLFEKNWVPFDYEGLFLIGYTINPHAIMSVNLENGINTHLFTTSPQIRWDWGIIRGGTPAVLMDGEYLGFFHSSCHDPVTHRYTYYVGAYTFQSRPPFSLTRISAKPFTHKDFYSTPEIPLSTSLVLFPAGLVVKGNQIFVSYGENDGAIKVMEIDKNLLYKTLQVLSPL